MKNLLFGFGQFLLFLFIFLAGSLTNPLHLRWFVTHPAPFSTRFFVPDGLLLMILVFMIITLTQAIRGMFRTAGIVTTAAFFLAFAVGFLAKFGFATHDLY